jgi:hypothetical protein
MAEEQEFQPAGEEQDIWLTEEAVQKLLRGQILWREIETNREQITATAEEEAEKNALRPEDGEAAERSGFAEPELFSPGGGAAAKKYETPWEYTEAVTEEAAAETGRPEPELFSLGGGAAAEKHKMPWEYTEAERAMIWKDAGAASPPWLADNQTDTKSFGFTVNEMQQILTEETNAASPFLRGLRLIVLMAVLAAATFGVWWYFIY